VTTPVSVIIPTTLRQELIRALASVRRQEYSGPVETIVVADTSTEDAEKSRPEMFPGEELIVTGGGFRGGGARNAGIARATGEWIALLDDDDEWQPNHLSSLMSVVDREGWDGMRDSVVVASRARQRSAASAGFSGVVPSRPIRVGENVEDYLFRGRRPSVGRSSLFVPTLLVSRKLAQSVRWDEGLKRHQDWDWLVRAQHDGGAVIRHTDVASCIVWVGSQGSISATADWEASLRWVARVSDRWDNRTRADFIAAQALRYATSSRSLLGVWRCASMLVRVRALPGPGPLALGLSGILGRGLLQRGMLTSARGGRRSHEA
jgi:glycosyltransferase involved in cell wall biosynthesis